VVYLPQCAVLDCIEFSAGLRVVDVAADLAFLKMDLEFLGRADLSRHLLARYTERLGDTDVGDVIDFYTSYRAWVRGKIACIKLDQVDRSDPEASELVRRARRYFELAHFHALLFHQPLLVTVGGLPGTGKKTLARNLSDSLGATTFSSDVLRKETTSSHSDLYSEVRTRATYLELERRAAESLRTGSSVVVDASFTRFAHRHLFRCLAGSQRVRHVHFECQVSREVAHDRIRARANLGNDPSDATPEVYDRMQDCYEASHMGEAHVIDTARRTDEVTESALNVLRGLCACADAVSGVTAAP